MKVRISYAVELNKVPSETARMLDECAGDAQMIAQLLSDLVDDLMDFSVDRETFGSTIEKCRDLLVKTDSRLNDNLMIMGGFFSAKQQQIDDIEAEQLKAQEEQKEKKRLELEKELGEL
jgi:hypothetical protein